MSIAMLTTKNENSSAGLSTEILPLHSAQGQNDTISMHSIFKAMGIIRRGVQLNAPAKNLRFRYLKSLKLFVYP